jgi:hypothetical protein
MIETPQSVFIVRCPLGNCHWTSEPLHSKEHAHEARRGHLSAHAHGDLVNFISNNASALVDRYERLPGTLDSAPGAVPSQERDGDGFISKRRSDGA